MISKPINYNSNLYVEHVDGIAIKQGVNAGKKVVHINDFIDDEHEHIAFVVNDWEFQDVEIQEFNLETHLQQLEHKVDELIETTYSSLWYSSKGDIALTAVNPNSQWNQEAIELSQWIDVIYSIFDNYRNTVIQETHQDIETFINNLPKWQNK